MKGILVGWIIGLFSISATAQSPANILIDEFQRVQNWIGTQIPDGEVGGLYDFIQRDGYKILYSKQFDGDHDTIRFFLNRKAPEQDFAITYHLSRHITHGRTVLRRFIGPEPTGWRNDTVDFHTKEYLGAQGAQHLRFRKDEQKILQEWGFTWID